MRPLDAVPPGCPPEAELRALHGGELSDAACERLAEHLARCPRCTKLVEQLTPPYRYDLVDPRASDLPAYSDSAVRRMWVACDRLTRDDQDDELRAVLEASTGYRLGALLGSGGMGRVYAGAGPEGRVALKVILPRFAGIRSYLVRFEAEARTLRLLNNIRVVRYLKLLRIGECPVLVMEYVSGENLQAIVRHRGPHPAAEAAAYAVQILEALEYLAGFGVVHRDVKPGNCLVTETGELKLVDFGIAKDLTASDELTATGHLVGTPAYMSPEQAARPQEVDPRSDLYAVGCVLYELLTGRPPFVGAVAAVLGEHARVVPVPPRTRVPGVPRAISRATLRLLAKLPADRFQTAREAITALEPYARVAGRWGTTRRAALVAGAAVAATVALVLWLSLEGRGGGPAPPPPPPGDAEVLTVQPRHTFWLGRESWREYELRFEAKLGGDEFPVVYFHANGGAHSALRLGVLVKNRPFVCFEETDGGRVVRLPDLQELQIQREAWVPVSLQVSPFGVTCVVNDNAGAPLSARLSRAEGRVGLGTESGPECQFRNIVVMDRAGATLWSGFPSR